MKSFKYNIIILNKNNFKKKFKISKILKIQILYYQTQFIPYQQINYKKNKQILKHEIFEKIINENNEKIV